MNSTRAFVFVLFVKYKVYFPFKPHEPKFKAKKISVRRLEGTPDHQQYNLPQHEKPASL